MIKQYITRLPAQKHLRAMCLARNAYDEFVDAIAAFPDGREKDQAYYRAAEAIDWLTRAATPVPGEPGDTLSLNVHFPDEEDAEETCLQSKGSKERKPQDAENEPFLFDEVPFPFAGDTDAALEIKRNVAEQRVYDVNRELSWRATPKRARAVEGT